MAFFYVGIAFSASMPVSAASKAKVHAWFEFSSRFFATSNFSLRQRTALDGAGIDHAFSREGR
ncbi:hypothetical protein X770_24370 [Mesorhizobium sp. LSJC269B00]|uniref:hypothetical protein n=1 Tax=Mesorhizobium sp. LSJC269B00 TaxID=1287326 RepID=UPI0003CDEB9F|nr:hypothetical protein [Mesorhizobium sp. LSJC269B00]ESW84461.1 hypothetical protein X770_24370 [Mesorhizobium sp. LSJC269B00]